jgi:hypothetical protein
MGGAGQYFGIATYRGISGLDLFLAILGGLADVDPMLVQRRQDGLLLEYVDKENLNCSDLKLAEQVNFQPINDKSWIVLRNFSRGWSPSEPSDQNILAMNAIFSVLPLFSQLQDQNPNWTTQKGNLAFPIFNRQTSADQWLLEWWSDDKILKASEKLEATNNPPTSKPIDEITLNEVKKIKKETGKIWEAYSFYAPNAEIKDGRSFFPEVCVIMDCESERCLVMEIIDPSQNRSGVLRDLAIKAILSEKILPEGFIIEETELLKDLLSLKKILGIDFKINAAKNARYFEAGMFENSKVRIFT